MVASSCFEEVDAVAHVHLVVAREEVNLHSCHSEALAPGELLLAVFWFVKSELWSGSTIDPSHGGDVPYHGTNALVFGIANGILNSFAVLELVPLFVAEDIGQAASDGEVNVFLNDIEVVGTVVISPVDPRHHSWLYPRRVVQFGLVSHICHQR